MPRLQPTRFAKAALFLLLFGICLELLTHRAGTPDPRRDTQAIRVIQTIHTAEVQYRSQYDCFATSLQQLAPLVEIHPVPGYRFALTGTCEHYVVTADCDKCASFQSDQTMVIRKDGIPIR